jgi:hypothetical protein
MEEMNSIRKPLGGARPSGAKPHAGRVAMIMVGAGSLSLGLAGAASAAAPGSVRPAVASISSVVAGYYAVPTQGFASAGATFVVPKATCTLNGTGQFFGITDDDPASGSTAAHSIAAVSVVCNDTTPDYTSETFVNGTSGTAINVKPGDTVVVSLFLTASTEVAALSDLTTGKSASTSTTPIADSAVSIGVDSTTPTEKFTPVSFTKVQVNSQYLSMVPSTEYNLLDGAKTLIKTSAIASPGDSFSVTYKHAG